MSVLGSEPELGRAASLVSEIIDWRTDGIITMEAGSTDDDLLGAVEALEQEIRTFRGELGARG